MKTQSDIKFITKIQKVLSIHFRLFSQNTTLSSVVYYKDTAGPQMEVESWVPLPAFHVLCFIFNYHIDLNAADPPGMAETIVFMMCKQTDGLCWKINTRGFFLSFCICLLSFYLLAIYLPLHSLLVLCYTLLVLCFRLKSSWKHMTTQ